MVKRLPIIISMLILISLIFPVSINAEVNTFVTEATLGASDSGVGVPVDRDGGFKIHFQGDASYSDGVIKIWGPGLFEIITNQTSGSVDISNLEDGDFTFHFEQYDGPVEIEVEGGTITIPGHTHSATTNVGTISVSIDDVPEQTINLDDATIIIPAGVVRVGQGFQRVIVDKTAPVVSNTNFHNFPTHTNQQTLTLTGTYVDNFLTGTVGVRINPPSGPFYQMGVTSKQQSFNLDFNLNQGENKIVLVAMDRAGNSVVSQEKTIFYDNTSPTTNFAGITFTPDIKDKFISNGNYKIDIQFNESMDTGEVLSVELYTQKDLRINVTPREKIKGWDSDTKWLGEFVVPAGQGNLYDGQVRLKVFDGKDKAGNLMTEFTQTNVFRIDTTRPFTNNNMQESFVEVSPSPATTVFSETQAFNLVLKDNIFAGVTGSGVDTSELEVWVDANGNGAQEDNELLLIKDSTTLSGVSFDGNSISIIPSQLPAEKFQRYTASKVRVEIRKIRDSVQAEFGGPNTAPNMSFEFNVNLVTRPVIEFMYWTVATTPEVTLTPPVDAHTPFNNQQVKFRIIPTGNVANNPKLKIDTSSVTVTVNSVPYKIQGTDSVFASDALTYTGTDTIEVTFNPGSSEIGLLNDGRVTIRVEAKDLNNTPASIATTAFFVDTVKPVINMQYPRNGWVTFDATQEIKFSIDEQAPGEIYMITVKTNNQGTTRNQNIRANQTQVSGDLDLYYNSEKKELRANLPAGEKFSDGNVNVEITVEDKAGNKGTHNLKFWVAANTKLILESGSVTTGQNPIQINGHIKGFPQALTQATEEVYVNVQLEDGYGGVHTTQTYFQSAVTSGNETIVRFSFSNVNLKSGPNYIKADAVDNLGNILKPFVISTQLITVIYDNIPPTGTYGLKILENKQSYAVIAWEAFNDEYSNPVDYSIQIAIEESFSTIIATHSTMSTQYQISLEDYPYSAYYVRVIAKDSLGNAAEPSKHVIISMDKQSPIVSLLTVLDNSPDSTSSPLYPDFKPQTGDLSLVIQFNEKMDKTVDLSKDGNIRVRLEGNYSFKIENGRWASDYTWVSNISKNSFGNGYSSYFKFVVKGAKDVAGNEMQMITSKEYYLYNVPEIEKPKIFPNPLDDREIMILLKPLQTLQTNPRVKIDGKDVEFNLLTRSWYGASHRIMSNQTGIKSIQVTITDLNGNVGHWPDDYEQIADFNFNLFKTASLTNNSPVMLSSVDEKAVLTVPANSVVEDTDIYTLNFEDEEIGQSNAPSFAPVSNINRIELEKLSSNIAFAPAVKLNNNAEIEFELPTDSSNGLCIMRKVGSAWVYVPTEIRENKVAGIVDSLGTFGLFRDNIAPEVNKNIKNGDVLTDGKKTIDVTLSENGSGVKSVRLYLNGKLVGEEKGVSKILYSPATYYREGDNEFVVEAEDNAGNKSLNKTIFRAPGAISFNSIRVYPNPVNDMAEFSFNLDSVASQISLRIYSVDGRLVYRDGIINMQNGVFFWFGNDLRGRNVSNGTYIYEIEAKGNGVGKTKGKIAVLR